MGAAIAFSCAGSSESGDDDGAGGQGTVETCESLQAEYAAALDEAQQCSPTAIPDPCSELVVDGVACLCPDFANPEHTDALARASAAAKAYRDKGCADGIVCNTCQSVSAGQCSAAGRCEPVIMGTGHRCRVDGVIYEDGQGGIPDPTSCNQCMCDDGELACGRLDCPEPCPPGQALGKECALCGPTDECLVIEHACFPTCDGTTCGNPGELCFGGVCVTGICG